MAAIVIELRDPDGVPVVEVTGAKRVVLRSSFGAMKAKCFIELYRRDRGIPIAQAYECRVRIGGRLKFRGRVADVRRHTQGDELSFYAAREPEVELTEGVSGTYEDQSPSEILLDLVSRLASSPLTCVNADPVGYSIDRLTFVRFDLFYAIDLLAKLSGNYLWDIGWDDALRFRSHTREADHILHFDRRKSAVKVWKTSRRVKNAFELFGGVVNENQFYRWFVEQESVARYGARRKSLFARPITTQLAYGYLRQAVLEQAPWPVFEKYVDLFEEDVSIGFGDTLRLLHTGMVDFDEEQLYRVKLEEIQADCEGRLRLRYYLADLWESASRFLRYLDHEVGEPEGDYVARRIGSFRLDFSALDSQAHLD